MDKQLAKPDPASFDHARIPADSNQTMAGKMQTALALCVGVLLSLLAYTLHPQSRLLVIAISVFAIILAFMAMFWLVRQLSSVSQRRNPADKAGQNV
jgi:predicted RND superfamily exporter protein